MPGYQPPSRASRGLPRSIPTSGRAPGSNHTPARAPAGGRRTILPLGVVLAVLLLAAALAAPLLAGIPARQAEAAGAAPTGLHVTGNRLLDGTGRPLVLRGVNRSGSEYACLQGWGFFDGDDTMSDDSQVPLMRQWGVTAVNIPLNEACWLGINGVPAAYGGANYQQAIRHEVATLEAAGIVPILALFWTAPGTKQAVDHDPMPNADHSVALWQSVATTFKGDSAVIFRLDEEPHPAGNTDGAAAWRCWRDGGAACSEGYAVAGMQTLVDAVRGAGAANVLQLPGVQYGNSLSQFLAYKPADPLGNLMAAVDVYPAGNACGTVACYDSQYAPVAAAVPLMAGEFGESVDGDVCTTTRATALMDWFDAHNAGYLAWAWDTWGGCLQLIRDYTTGAPNGAWGQLVKQRLLARAADPSPAPSPAPSPSAAPGPSATPAPSPSPSASPVPSPSASPSPRPSPTATKVPTATATPGTTRTLVVYDNRATNGFSASAFAFSSRKACDTTTFTSASCSYAIAYNAWGGLNFQAPTGGLVTDPYAKLVWTVRTNGLPIGNFSALFTDTNGAVIQEVVLDSGNVAATLANGWVRVEVPISELNPNHVAIGEIQLKNATATKLPSINIDDVQLIAP